MSYGLPAESAPAAPTCYRHPGRETWIQCTRCGRPICPECMTTAPVGYQCPECVREGEQSVRRGRTTFGGSLTRDSRVTMGIIGVCALLFLVVSLAGMGGGLSRLGMQPVAIAVLGQWGRLPASMFLHGGWLHIAFNMYVLYVLGPPLERLLGHLRFLGLFLLSGLGGAVASYCFSPIQTLSVGASGAIFGLMAAMIVVGTRLHQDVSQVVILLVINVALGFAMAGIDWRAHLGGAVTGAVTALILTHGRGDRSGSRAAVQAVALLTVVAVLVVAVAWRTEQIRSMLVG